VNEQALKARDDRLHIPELARKARLRRVLFGLLLLAAAGVGFAYYNKPKPVPEMYRLDQVATRLIVQQIETVGSVDVRSRVEVPAPVAGRIIAIHVQTRQQVKQGDLLATLDERAAELSVRGAKAAAQAAAGRLGQAQAAHAAAEQVQERVRRLHEKGLASQQELADANAEFARAAAALSAARAERKLAGQGVESAELGKSLGKIVAPAPGVVLRAPDRVGAAVGPEQGPLFVIGEPLSTMRVDALVGETEIAQVQPGRKAEVLVQALPGRTFEATVERLGIEPRREGGVVQYPVTLLVDNPEGVLLPGMSARVRMEVARAEAALSVHEAALRFTPPDEEPAPARSRVFVRRGGVGNDLEPVDVKAGISDGMYTAVQPRGGATLDDGDQVVIGLLRPDAANAKKPNVSLGGK
jgi:HlyD family secretion protein